MNNNVISRIAAIVFALTLVPFGINHFRMAQQMGAMVPLPGGAIWIYITGAGFLLAAISFIINVMPRLAGYMLGAMLLTIAIIMHLIPYLRDTADPNMNFIQFLKDTAMAAGAVFIGSVSKK